MRKLLLIALLLPLLCWGGDFGYSYEEEERQNGIIYNTYGDSAITTKTVGIFKVYLDYDMPTDATPWVTLWVKLDDFEYGGLKFVWKWENANKNIWVENVRELDDKPWWTKWKGFKDNTPTHAEAWEIRCLAIEEIERSKEKCKNYCHEEPYKSYHYWQYCPCCGKSLK